LHARWRFAVLGLAALAGVYLIARWPGGAPLAIGAVAAVAAGLFWPQVLRIWSLVDTHTDAVNDFGRALLPLALPLLVVLAFGAIAFAWFVQLVIVFAIGVIAWRAIVLPEIAAIREGFRGPTPGAIGLAVVVAVTIAVVLARPTQGPFDDHLGLLLLYTTIPLWIGAVFLRAGGYATTPIRALIGVCLVLCVILLAALGGVLPGGDWLADNLSWLTPNWTVLAIVALLALSSFEPLSRGKLLPEDWSGSLRGAGLMLALLAAAMLGGAAIDGAINSHARSNEAVDSRPVALLPSDHRLASSQLHDRTLAEKYKPALVLAKGERWRPVAVNRFVRDASLINRAGDRNPNEHLADLPKTCPGQEVPGCFRLELDKQGSCTNGDDTCARQPPPGPRETLGTSYFRVVRKAKPNTNYAFANSEDYTEPVASHASILIQYWFFYRYNEWERQILTGTLAQRHQSDWEFVTVGLDRSAAPLFFAYSEHCGGTWRPWDQVQTVTPKSTHPLVAVALGSHANYVSTDERRSPDWASCGGTAVPKGFLNLLSYASNVRDETSFGTEIPPDQLHLIRATEGKPPMSFPGTWGADDLTVLENKRKLTLKQGAAPATPSFQRAWLAPLPTIFCSSHWEPPDGHSNEPCTRPTG
jgi:hypothetical protein